MKRPKTQSRNQLGATSRLSWRFENASRDEADVYLYDVIGDPWEGVTANDFVQQLRAITAKRINLHINSPGGYINDAIAIYNSLLQHPANVVAHIDAIAASAASFVAMSADEIRIAKTAKMMIHNAQGIAVGDGNLMREMAEHLDAESENIASIYADRAGGTLTSWLQAMSANDGFGTEYRGQEAVDAGLADVMVDPRNTRNERREALRNQDPNPTGDESEEEAASKKGEFDGIDFGSILRENATFTPEPTLEELLAKHPLDRLMAEAITK